MTEDREPYEPQTVNIDARRNPDRDRRALERVGLLPDGWANLGSAREELVTLIDSLEDVVAMGVERETELLRERARKSKRIRSKEADREISAGQAREAIDRLTRRTAYEHTPEWWAEMHALELAAVARGMIAALESGNLELALAVAARKIRGLAGPTASPVSPPSSQLADRWRGRYARFHTHAGGATPKNRARQFSEAELEELRAEANRRRRENPRLSQERSVTGLSLKGREMPEMSARHLAELLFNPRSRAAVLEDEDEPDAKDSSGRS